MTLKLMTFNLRINLESDGGNAWPFRKLLAGQVIAARKPAVLGVQEASIDMLHDLQHALPNYSYVGEGREGDSKDEHCAIFYDKREIDILETGTFWLSESPQERGSKSWATSYPRICTWAECRIIKEDQRLFVFNTHLDHESQEAREQGIRMIYNHLNAEKRSSPAVLMGDFNAYPSNKVIRFLEGTGAIEGTTGNMASAFELGKPDTLTYHGYEGGKDGEPIDYIFVTPHLKVESHHIITESRDGLYPSDHYPVEAVITFD